MDFDFDETYRELADILLRLHRLIHDSEIRSMFPFPRGSKKKRSKRSYRFTPLLSSPKTCLSSPKSKIIKVTAKRKTSPEDDDLQNSSSLCAVNDDESSPAKKKKEMIQPSEADESSRRRFSLFDLNLPPLIGEGEKEQQQQCHDEISEKEGISPRWVSARGEDGRNCCCSNKDLNVRVKFGSDDERNALVK